VLSKVGLEGLAGNSSKEISSNQPEETEASFQKKTETGPQISPDLLAYLPLLQQLDAAFDDENLKVVMKVITRFSEQPANLKTVAELLNIQIP
jgi:hypothetical protein